MRLLQSVLPNLVPNQETARFRLSGGEVEGICSNGSWCVKFKVRTTADAGLDLGVVVADLNEWLAERG